MTPTVKDFLLGSIAASQSMLIKDVEALSKDVLSRSPGGVARPPFDFLYEIAVVNHCMAKRLRGEDPGPSNDGWIVAPPEFCDIPVAVKALNESFEDFTASLTAFDESRFLEPVAEVPGWTYLKLAGMASIHTAYHDGQLNTIQALNGDDAIHWM